MVDVVVDSVRLPAVAGSFYPADPDVLRTLVARLLADAGAPIARCPKALIVPHAGYVYSGPIAASAFTRIADHAAAIERVVLIGPSHRVYVAGLASPGVARLRTPLGELVVDVDALRRVPGAIADPSAHAREHSLEVMLPFLQQLAPHAAIAPLVGNEAPADVVAGALDALWGGPETLIVISSDLSHHLPYRAGRARDERTAARIVALDGPLDGDDACGSVGINGLLRLARRRSLRIELLDLRSSGDTAGTRDEVVGYGAFAAWEDA
jgi:AmmeMemoRadiSam system protein B